ncbi:MAG: hypothetical protein CMC23_00075 [Flavobacteriaceae bacterium]|nr:hypothetical protein [Flavobacteriaceae bacterium]|tara:strand:+ start:9430 stop:10608 length:1179 start_codon:yes stop_codon:yes gene_type:complete
MNNLSLEEVANIYSGNSINAKLKKEKYTDKNFSTPYVATKDLSKNGDFDYNNGVTIPDIELDNFKIAPKGSTLICMEGGSAGKKIGLVKQDVCFVNKLGALVPNEKINNRYLYYSLQTPEFQAQFKSSLTGIIGGVSLSKLKKLQIPVPPLQEQEKIVERIQIATRSIDSKLKNIENQMFLVKNLFESYVNNTVHSNEIKGVLGDFITIQRGGSPRPIGKYLTNDKDGLNWIKISDATNSSKYIKETKQKITKDGLNKTREVKPGDFLLSNSMSFGRPYIMKISGCIHDGWLKLSEYEKYFDIDFLYYFLGSRDIFQKFNKSSRGSTVQNLNTSIVSSIEVGIPSLEKQRNVSQKIMNFEKEIEKYSKSLFELDSLYKNLNLSLLQKEFSYE